MSKMTQTRDILSERFGHDMEVGRVTPELPGESLMVIMQTDDTVTFREAGESDAWLTADHMVEL